MIHLCLRLNGLSLMIQFIDAVGGQNHFLPYGLAVDASPPPKPIRLRGGSGGAERDLFDKEMHPALDLLYVVLWAFHGVWCRAGRSSSGAPALLIEPACDAVA